MSAIQRVLLVCTANICRSPMAHAILHHEVERQGLGIAVDSAGILDMYSQAASVEAQRTCQRAGIALPKIHSKYLSAAELRWADVVLVMERRHRREIEQRFSVASAHHVRLLSDYDPLRRGEMIEDPVGCPSSEFERCFQRMGDCLRSFLQTVTR